MTCITNEQIDAQVQQRNKKAMMWHELQDGTIYTIVSTRLINAQHGEECILIWSDGTKVFAPRGLINLFKRQNKPFPRYVRPKGRMLSKTNPERKYYAFDLVKLKNSF